MITKTDLQDIEFLLETMYNELMSSDLHYQLDIGHLYYKIRNRLYEEIPHAPTSNEEN